MRNISDKVRVAKKLAKTKKQIERLEDKQWETSSERKEKKLGEKITQKQAYASALDKILDSPTSESKSTEFNFNVNVSKTHKTNKK